MPFFHKYNELRCWLINLKKKEIGAGFVSTTKGVVHGENPALTISFVYTTQSCGWKKNNLHTTE